MKIQGVFLAAAIAACLVGAGPSGAFAQDTRHRVEWSGEVDEEAIIFISHNRIGLKTSTIEPVHGLKYKFGAAFPRKKVECHFKSKKGRGKIQLIQQPSAANNYTAAVRITDTERARAKYEFVLAWE